MSQKSHCTQPTMYKYFYFKTEIKTKVDLYMPCEAMAHSPKYLYIVGCVKCDFWDITAYFLLPELKYYYEK